MSITENHHSKLIILNGNDKKNINNDFLDFHISGHDHELDKVRKVSLMSFSLENTYFNIDNSNNQIVVSSDIDPLNIVSIPEGDYKLSDLKNALTTAINAVLTNICTVSSVSPQNQKLVFSLDVGTMTMYNTHAQNTINNIIGASETVDYINFVSQTMPLKVNLSGVNLYSVHLDVIKNNSLTTYDQDADIIGLVPAGDLNFFQFFTPSNPDLYTKIFSKITSFTSFRLTIRDAQTNKILRVPNNANLLICLKVWYR